MFLQFAQQVAVYRGIRLTQNVSSYDMIMIPEMKGLSTSFHINEKLLWFERTVRVQRRMSLHRTMIEMTLNNAVNMPKWGKVTVNRQRNKVNRERESIREEASRHKQSKQLWDENQPQLRKPDSVITTSSSVRPDCKIKILLKQKKTSLISAPIVQLSGKKKGQRSAEIQFLKDKSAILKIETFASKKLIASCNTRELHFHDWRHGSGEKRGGLRRGG